MTQKKHHMCTPEETYNESVKAVEHVLFEEKENGKSRFENELENAFFKSVGKWIVGGGLLVVISMVGIYYQVKQNTDAINEGGRYTQEEADRDFQYIQRQIDAIAEDIDEIAEFVRNNTNQ